MQGMNVPKRQNKRIHFLLEFKSLSRAMHNFGIWLQSETRK